MSRADIMLRRIRKQEPGKLIEQARMADKKAKKAERVSKTAMVAAKAPTKAANKQKIVNPVKVSALRVGRKS